MWMPSSSSYECESLPMMHMFVFKPMCGTNDEYCWWCIIIVIILKYTKNGLWVCLCRYHMYTFSVSKTSSGNVPHIFYWFSTQAIGFMCKIPNKECLILKERYCGFFFSFRSSYVQHSTFYMIDSEIVESTVSCVWWWCRIFIYLIFASLPSNDDAQHFQWLE